MSVIFRTFVRDFALQLICSAMNDHECLYIVENRNAVFSFPVHMHEAWELTFIQGGKGLTRIIGDSVETIDDLEVVLLTQYDMRHAWRAENMECHDIREVRLQFSNDFISPQALRKPAGNHKRHSPWESRHFANRQLQASLRQ